MRMRRKRKPGPGASVAVSTVKTTLRVPSLILLG